MKKHCDAPKITGISVDTTVHLNVNIKLACNAEGVPHPAIDWRSPQNDIYNFRNADQYEGILVHSDGSLTIMDLKDDDFGNYTCIATSKGGSVEQVTVLTQAKGDQHPSQTQNSDDEPHIPATEKPDSQNPIPYKGCHKNCSCRSRRADCSSKGLKAIPADGEIPDDTITYNLAGNRITRVDVMANFPKLVELSLDDNLIEEIEAKVRNK